MEPLSTLHPALCIPATASSRLVLVLDHLSADGSFVLHHYIATALKGGDAVRVFGLDGRKSHYASIGRKLGVNLDRCEADGSFKYIDVMGEMGGREGEGHSLALLRHLVLKPTLVVIDDALLLSHILCGSGSDKGAVNVVELIQDIKSSYSDKGVRATTVVLMHKDGENEVEPPTVAGMIDEMAEVNILVSPLPTGYSKDIHGSITVRPRPLTPMKVNPTRVHYKLLDGSIKTFIVGDGAC